MSLKKLTVALAISAMAIGLLTGCSTMDNPVSSLPESSETTAKETTASRWTTMYNFFSMQSRWGYAACEHANLMGKYKFGWSTGRGEFTFLHRDLRSIGGISSVYIHWCKIKITARILRMNSGPEYWMMTYDSMGKASHYNLGKGYNDGTLDIKAWNY